MGGATILALLREANQVHARERERERVVGSFNLGSIPAAFLHRLAAHAAVGGCRIVNRAEALEVGPFLQDSLRVLGGRVGAGEGLVLGLVLVLADAGRERSAGILMADRDILE